MKTMNKFKVEVGNGSGLFIGLGGKPEAPYVVVPLSKASVFVGEDVASGVGNLMAPDGGYVLHEVNGNGEASGTAEEKDGYEWRSVEADPYSTALSSSVLKEMSGGMRRLKLFSGKGYDGKQNILMKKETFCAIMLVATKNAPTDCRQKIQRMLDVWDRRRRDNGLPTMYVSCADVLCVLDGVRGVIVDEIILQGCTSCQTKNIVCLDWISRLSRELASMISHLK